MTTVLETYKSQLREKMLQDLICGRYMSEESILQKCEFLNIDKNIRYFVIVAEMDYADVKFQSGEDSRSVFGELHLLKALKAALLDVEGTTLLSDTEGYYVILVPDYGAEDIASACNIVRENFRNYTGFSVTFGIGGPAETMTALRSSYTKARKALLYKYLLGNNMVICYEDIVAREMNPQHLANIQTIQSQIMQRVRLGETGAIEGLCEEWFYNLAECSPEVTESLLIQFVSNLSVELLAADTSLAKLFGDESILIRKILNFDTIFETKLWLKQTLQYICDYIGEKNQKRSRRLARKAAQYIDEHYTEKITIETIANVVYLSEGYLMTIFKREMGVSIVSYLTMRRMDKAKELLLENNLRIYEVAERVGYANATFFSTAFRNCVGMSPKQFKESVLKKYNHKKG